MKNLFLSIVALSFGLAVKSQSTGKTGLNACPEIYNNIGYNVTVNYEVSDCTTGSPSTFVIFANSSFQGDVDLQNIGIELTAYPNPAKTELFYAVNSSGLHRCTLTDLSGRVLAEGEQHGSKVRLDLNAYQPGVYILTIIVGRASKTTRFIIE